MEGMVPPVTPPRPRPRESTPFALDAAWVVVVIMAAMALWTWSQRFHLEAQRADIAAPQSQGAPMDDPAHEPPANLAAYFPHPGQDQLRHGG